MKTLELQTGVKGGQSCQDLWNQYGRQCWGNWQDWAKAGQDIGASFAQQGMQTGQDWAARGQAIGRSFARGWY